MKVKFEITYDAEKLAKQMPKMIRTYMNDALVSLQKGSKDAIKSGKLEKISDFTKFVREEGLSGKSKSRSSSTKPLRHTGQLFRSIKASKKDKSLEFMEYGKYHLGMGKNETFDITLDDFRSQAWKGSGVAYKIKGNKWTKFIQKELGWKRDHLAGKSVDIRDWLQFDKKINTIKKEFFDSLDKNFKK